MKMSEKTIKTPAGLCISLILILFFCGCINFPNITAEKFSLAKEKHFEDLHYAIEIYPSSVAPGKILKLRVLLEPKKDLKNVVVSISDPCLFTIDGGAEKNLGSLKANTRNYVRFDLRAPNHIEMETNCKIKLRITYIASFDVLTDVAVLSEAEKLAGNKIAISKSKLPSALDVYLSFSKEQPFIDGEEVFMYINYRNIGNGIISELDEGNVVIDLPNNLRVKNCGDYAQFGNKLILNKKILFVDNRGETSACLFEARANSPIDIEKLSINGKYKYEIDDSIIVTLEKR